MSIREGVVYVAATKEDKPKVQKVRRAKACKMHEQKIRRLADDWRTEAEDYFKALNAPPAPKGHH